MASSAGCRWPRHSSVSRGSLVLDEPTFAQDRHGVVALLDHLRARAVEGMAIVAVSHDERFVAAFADRVLELADGQLRERGAP